MLLKLEHTGDYQVDIRQGSRNGIVLALRVHLCDNASITSSPIIAIKRVYCANGLGGSIEDDGGDCGKEIHWCVLNWDGAVRSDCVRVERCYEALCFLVV